MSRVKVISVRQPWAWLIVEGHKDIENRTQNTRYRGEVLIHASKQFHIAMDDRETLRWIKQQGITLPERERFLRGGIIGRATLVDIVKHSRSIWFYPGAHGYVLENAEPLPFYPVNGMAPATPYLLEIEDSYLRAIGSYQIKNDSAAT